MATLDGFEMESNVARDVLSTASSFGSLPKVIAEYTTNSIDARDNGQTVNVAISKRRTYGGGIRVVISDDARGMDDTDLRRFFFMHAENEDRRRGRNTRGRFGTGKAAAFGIGSSLQVETRRDGRKWVVRLEKDELESAVRERRKPKPEVQVDGEPTAEPHGTDIIIDGVTRNLDEPRIARELRRRLGRQLDVHAVVLFSSRVQTVEPRAARTWEPFRSAGHTVAGVLGDDVRCEIKAAATAVEDSIRGIIVTANDFPVAQIEASGDYAARIFGHCEVLALERDESTPGPYTDARDLTLNEDNRTAGPLAEWLRECLARVTGDLGAEERERRRLARDEALRRAATKMETVLNRHYQGEFRRTRTRAGDVGTRPTSVVPDPAGEFVQPQQDGVAGYDIVPGQPQGPNQVDSPPEGEGPDTPTVEVNGRPRERDPFGDGRGDAVTPGEEPARPRRRTGGFRIDWENAGAEAPRSNYIESELTILINLDHPEIAAAYAEGDTAPIFRMLVFEAAAQEYCYATAYQQLEEDPSMDGSDTVQYVRTTIDHLTRDVADVVADLAWLPMPSTATG
jgi:hypothetical protein